MVLEKNQSAQAELIARVVYSEEGASAAVVTGDEEEEEVEERRDERIETGECPRKDSWEAMSDDDEEETKPAES